MIEKYMIEYSNQTKYQRKKYMFNDHLKDLNDSEKCF